MTDTALDNLIACHTALIAALDARDAGAIEHASMQLALAVTYAQSYDAWRESAEARAKIEHGLKQSNAARTRVNYLSEWTRQRIDRLNELRGASVTHTYANIRNRT
jgi:hypothetical protein